MLGRLNHVAIAVPDLAAASATYRDTLGAVVTEPQALPDHGVTVVFIDLGNTKVELLEPLGAGSPIAAFLEKRDAQFPLRPATDMPGCYPWREEPPFE